MNPGEPEELAFNILKVQKRWRIRERFIYDKILHDDHIGNVNIFNDSSLKCIFMIREPISAIQSISKLRAWDIEKSAKYYNKRLLKLSEYSLSFAKEKPLYITYQQLIDDTEKVFEGLQKYLCLSSSLSEEYHLLSTTGKKNIGDTSKNIRSGRILRDSKVLNQQKLNCSEELNQLVIDVYVECSTQLSS